MRAAPARDGTVRCPGGALTARLEESAKVAPPVLRVVRAAQAARLSAKAVLKRARATQCAVAGGGQVFGARRVWRMHVVARWLPCFAHTTSQVAVPVIQLANATFEAIVCVSELLGAIIVTPAGWWRNVLAFAHPARLSAKAVVFHPLDSGRAIVRAGKLHLARRI